MKKNKSCKYKTILNGDSDCGGNDWIGDDCGDDCDEDILDKSNECDAFRKMPRIINTDAVKNKRIKRLQEKSSRTIMRQAIQKQTGRALERLISEILKKHPETTTGKYEGGKELAMRETFGDCLAMMDNLKVSEDHDDLPDRMGGLRMREQNQGEYKEDLSFWEGLEALNEEDFKDNSEEEEEIEIVKVGNISLSKEEELMMRKHKKFALMEETENEEILEDEGYGKMPPQQLEDGTHCLGKKTGSKLIHEEVREDLGMETRDGESLEEGGCEERPPQQDEAKTPSHGEGTEYQSSYVKGTETAERSSGDEEGTEQQTSQMKGKETAGSSSGDDQEDTTNGGDTATSPKTPT